MVDAVRCAIEVQTGMVERNAGVPPERRIEFRVGIHLGDVVEEADGDLMGDGVNIAARLEASGGAGRRLSGGPAGRSSSAIPPCRRLLVEPVPIREAAEEGEVWSATTLAPSFSALEADVAA